MRFFCKKSSNEKFQFQFKFKFFNVLTLIPGQSKGHLPPQSYWPVQVCRVEEDTVSLVYYETGETNVVPKSSADLVPFTQQTIENLKLDQMKSRKLQKAIAAAEASM